ncbi:hypothetical protein HID58_060249, partial [Brassica napus]
WDPGIVGEVGQGIEFHHGKNKGILRRGSLSNLQGSDVGLGERIQGVLRKLGICASWIWILLINTMESYDYTGHIFEVLNTRILICFKEIGGIIYGSEMVGIWCFLIYCGFDKTFFGKIGDLRFNQGITIEILEAQEEDAITNAEGTDKHLPSQNFQEELARTQAAGTEVVSDPMDAENGLQVVQSLVENTTALEEDRIKAVFLEHGIDMDAADDLQDVSDGEFEKAVLELEQENGENVHVEEELATGDEEKLTEDGELAKRQGTRKRLFKTTIGTAASTKLRSASAMVQANQEHAMEKWVSKWRLRVPQTLRRDLRNRDFYGSNLRVRFEQAGLDFCFRSLSFSVSVLFGNKGIAVVGLALIWIFICMGCWNGFAEMLMGKLALWLVSLNQSQRADLHIEIVCTMGGKMETGAVRSFIGHSVIERLTRTFILIFYVHDHQNSRSGGCWDGLYGWRRKERSWFSIIVRIVDDLSGGIGLYVIISMELWWYIGNVFTFIVCNSIILCKLLAGLCLGIQINLEWRSCEVTVLISAKIG